MGCIFGGAPRGRRRSAERGEGEHEEEGGGARERGGGARERDNHVPDGPGRSERTQTDNAASSRECQLSEAGSRQ